jgi:transcription termination factor Rho
LDRKLAEKRIFPAINIIPSGTRREELLLDEDTVKQIWLLRRVVSMIAEDSPGPNEATERLLNRLSKTKNNAEFLATLSKEM